jgi:hypothetical protein
MMAVGTPMRSALRLKEWEMGARMSAVRRGESDGEGDRAAGGGGINAGRSSGSVGRGNSGVSGE